VSLMDKVKENFGKAKDGVSEFAETAKVKHEISKLNDIHMHNLVLSWWTWPTARLQRVSKLLGAAWIDGIYLTAWSPATTLVSISLFLIGLFEGATHWSLLSTAGGVPSATIHAADFSQMLPLLFVAAICGAFSSQFGLVLVAGFALGDFFFATSEFNRGARNLIFQLYVPQLLSYLVFFLLAVSPTLTSKLMVASLPYRLKNHRKLYNATSLLTACGVQGISVYAWTLATPMIVRTRWLWAGANPILAVVDYTGVLVPWLPLTAAVAVAVRAWLLVKAKRKLSLSFEDFDRKHGVLALSDGPKHPQIAIRSIGLALLTTLLISGLFDNLFVACFIFVVILALFLTRDFLLARVPGWTQWSKIALKIPLVFRWAAAIVLAFVITRCILTTPGFSAAENGVPGAFGAEILSFLVSLAVALALTSVSSGAASTSVPSKIARKGVQILAFLGLFAILTRPAYAALCLDPACCFGGNSLLAALAVAAFLLFVLFFVLSVAPEFGLAAAAAAGEEGVGVGLGAVAGEAAAAAEADAAVASAIADELGTGEAGMLANAAAQPAGEAAVAAEAAEAAEAAGELGRAASWGADAAEAAQQAQNALEELQALQADAATEAAVQEQLADTIQALETQLQTQGVDAAESTVEGMARDPDGLADLQTIRDAIQNMIEEGTETNLYRLLTIIDKVLG